MREDIWIKTMEIGGRLGCHQMPERSFFWKGYQFPVCARCTGVIIATIIATFVFVFKKISKGICICMSAVMLADWLVQRIGIKESNNKRRLITGLIGGFGYTTLHLYAYRYIYRFFTDKKV